MSLFDSDLTTRQTDDMIVNSELQKFVDQQICVAPQIQNIDYALYASWIYHYICENTPQWSMCFRNRNKIDVRNIKFRLMQHEPAVICIVAEYDIDDNHFETKFELK